MTPETAATAITDLVKMMRQRLEDAARVAKAGHACAAAGSTEKGLEIVDELGQDLRDAKAMLEAMLGVSRCVARMRTAPQVTERAAGSTTKKRANFLTAGQNADS